MTSKKEFASSRGLFYGNEVSKADEFTFTASRALIVGINDYSHGIPALTTAVNDARRLAELLQGQHQYQVDVLLNQQASLTQLRKQFNAHDPTSFINRVSADDRVLFYFAGHGIAIPSDAGPVGYLVPQDARLDKAETTFLPMRELYHVLDDLPCHHLLVILDCCFAGAFRWSIPTTRHVPPSKTLYAERYRRYICHPARQAITSAADDQQALDIASSFFGQRQTATVDANHSPFALALFETLDQQSNKIITATELYLHLRDAVESQAEGQRHQQTPGLWPLQRHDKGEYVFIIGNPRLEPAPTLQPENNPYRGLEVYEEQHHELFFGRLAVIKELAKKIVDQPLTVVLGASGTGKSSLVRAGLLPHLREQANWHILPPLRPGKTPLDTLMVLLREQFPSQALLLSNPKAETPESTLSDITAAWHETHPNDILLLVIDQFEELITLCHDPKERSHLLLLLTRVLTTHPEQFRLILTLRSDFEPQFFQYFDVTFTEQWMDNRLIIPPMNQSEFREAIEGPAAAQVLYFEPAELVERLIEEVIQTPGGLPLLSFTLSELYLMYLRRGDESRALLEADYRTLGGVVGALRSRATAEFEALAKELDVTHQITMRRVMLRMVSLEGGKIARRRIPRTELVYSDDAENERVTTVIQRLTEARLLVADEVAGISYLEPAHDALVNAWDKLSEWLQQAGNTIALHQRLAQAALDWDQAEDEATKIGYLWHDDPRLVQLEMLLESSDEKSQLNQIEQAFLRASVRRRDLEEYQRRVKYAELLSAQAKSIKDPSSNLNLMLSREAILTTYLYDGSITTQAEDAVYWAIENAPQWHLVIKSDEFFFKSAIFNPDGNHLVTTIDRGVGTDINPLIKYSVQLWDVASGQLLRLFVGHQDTINSVEFSLDGKFIVTASKDRTARIWDVASGQEVNSFQRDLLRSASISPDNETIVLEVCTEAQIWEIATGCKIQTLKPERWIDQVVFSPDGKTVYLVLQGLTGEISAWNVNTGRKIRDTEVEGFTFTGGRKISRIIVSPDGKMGVAEDIAPSGPVNYTYRIYLTDIVTGKIIHTFDSQRIAAISPDGKFILTYGENDLTASLWEVQTAELVWTRQGYGKGIKLGAFNPNGKLICSIVDGVVRLWKVEDVKSQTTIQITHMRNENILAAFSATGEKVVIAGTAIVFFEGSANVSNMVEYWGDTGKRTDFDPLQFPVELSSDGRLLVTGQHEYSNNPIDEMWDIETGQPYQFPRIGTFSPDGQIVVSVQDEAIELWSAESKKQIGEVRKPSEYKVTKVAMSPDNQLLATVSEDQSVKLWNIDTGSVFFQIDNVSQEKISLLVFSPDSKALAVVAGSNTILHLWDLVTGQIHQTFEGHSRTINSVRFSPNGEKIITASGDRTARIWAVATGKEIRRLEGHTDSVQQALFSPNGEKILTASKDFTACIWPAIDTLVAQAEALITRHPLEFTPEEQQRFGVNRKITGFVQKRDQVEVKPRSKETKRLDFEPTLTIVKQVTEEEMCQVLQLETPRRVEDLSPDKETSLIKQSQESTKRGFLSRLLGRHSSDE